MPHVFFDFMVGISAKGRPEWTWFARWCRICVNKCCECYDELRDRTDPHGVVADVLLTSCWDCKRTLCKLCENRQLLHGTGGARRRCCKICLRAHFYRETDRLTNTSVTESDNSSHGQAEIGSSTSSSEEL